MCCFFAALLFFGPRLAFLIFWLFPAGQAKVNVAFDGWVFPLLGLIFIPWTTLVYVMIFPVHGFGWFWIILGVAADAAGYTSSYRTRKDLPGYSGP